MDRGQTTSSVNTRMPALVLRRRPADAAGSGRASSVPLLAICTDSISLPSEYRLVACISDVGPAPSDRTHDRCRHRNEIELFGHLAAVGVGPVEELEGLSRRGRILGLLVHQDEGRTRDRPGACAGFV